MTVYNRAPNPTFNDGFTGWTDYADDYAETIETSGGWDGANFYRTVRASGSPGGVGVLTLSIINAVPAAAGEEWTFSIYARPYGSAAGKKIYLQLSAYNGGTQLSSPHASLTLTAGWNRYVVSGTLPAATTRFFIDVFDFDPSTGANFAIGDGIDIDAVMLNEGLNAEPYTSAHEPLNWADGRNYDPSQLTIKTAAPGFILGEGVLGETPLGPDGGYALRTADFTSIQVNTPCVVENGLFVHREVESCTLTSTNPTHKDLRGQRLWIQYGPKQVFLGTVAETFLEETVDTENSYLAGNTPTRTHRVTIRCTPVDEFFATQAAPPRAFTVEPYDERLKSYLSLPTSGSMLFSDTDVDGGIGAVLQFNGGASSVFPETTLLDEPRTLLDTFRDLGSRVGMYYRYLRYANRIDVEGVARPFSGGSTIVSGLRFTDDPSLISDAPSTTYNKKTHEGVSVSYTSRSESEDSAMFTTGISVLANGSTYGPYLTAGTTRRQDIEVDLGNIWTGGSRVAQNVRSWVSALPLKSRPAPFTSRLVAPLQSTHQVQNRVPGVARLTRDGVTELVAIIGVTHTITPDRWLIEYTCAPPHLLTRVGDRDPSVPRNVTVTQPSSGADVTVSWNTPDSIPANQALYRHILYRTSGAFWTPSVPFDTEWQPISSTLVTAEEPGDPQSVVIPFASVSAGSRGFWVVYTTVATPGAGGFDDSELWSYPLPVTKTLS